MQRKISWLLANLLIVMVAFGALSGANSAQAQSTGPLVAPTAIEGNPTCKDLMGANYEIKVDPPVSGVYGPLTVIFTDDGRLVAFSSLVRVDAVFVKGGNEGGNFYDYRPAGTKSDSNLIVPTGQQISHVSFCWSEEPATLQVTKTAAGSYDRNINWALSKSASTDNLSGNAGESAGSTTWIVEATKNVEENNFQVSGDITVTNIGTSSGTFSISDILSDGTTAAVSCDTYTLATGATATCTYTATPANASATSNTATATMDGTNFSATVNVPWTANVIGDEEVTLGDARVDYTQSISSSTNETFPESFACSSNASDYTNGSDSDSYTNVATLTGANTSQSDDASVTVTCSLQPLAAVKTAAGSYDRTITWSLTKSVDVASYSGAPGQSLGTSNWNVVATKSVVNNNYSVTGEITISNLAAIDVPFSVSDLMNDGSVATVNCPATSIAAGATMVCSYTATPATSNATENVATVSGAGNADVTATAPVSFSANVIGDEEVTLGDARVGYAQSISSSTSKIFPESFVCSSNTALYVNGLYSVVNNNIATLTGSSTNLSANATVTLTCQQRWGNETATGRGIRYSGTSNWFMATAYTTAKVDLIAGQRYDAGDIYMSRNGDGSTTITITLHNGFRWANVLNNLKIQQFNTLTPKYQSPGSFANKYTVSGNTVTVTIPKSGSSLSFGIHGDVQRLLP